MIDIAALRKKLGMSAVELAAAIDVTPGFISQVENGKSGVSTDTAAKLARALGCTIDELLGEKKGPD
ncbi:helix-turn-helix domain-containing protein [Gemmiger formicilis]|uniref:helix-turn-helix domain-containing protein n=1 Tax=Gemmiger formicilis TaxID=745368 RepID=UPI003AB1C862